ncbi:MAG: hypothetical protein HYW09_01730 [Candidatus Niyogibacteria bacterium]|nr:hypothetical protein [Candidatus Niyogibacteria bacterium]
MRFTNRLKQFSEIAPVKSKHKNYRDELISRLTYHLNREREKKFKSLTKKEVAVLVNRNPFLAGKKNDGELKMLIDECLEKGNFKKFWWVVK